jgi:CubicO group peptidase (beta-lactamase class C family)
MALDRRRFLLSAAAATLAGRARAQGDALSAARGRADAAVARLIEQQTTPGIVAAIWREGQPAWQAASGVRAPGGPAIAADDIFRLASMTKPITSVAALMLADEGRLSLRDPVSRFLPEFQRMMVREADGTLRPASRPMLVLHLITHTAGLSYNFLNVAGIIQEYARLGVTDGVDATDTTTRENVLKLAHAPLMFDPGSAWAYSLGTDVLGAVVARAAGMPLDRFVAERITGPLGMTETVFRVDGAKRSRVPMPTRQGPGGTGTVPVTRREDIPFPASGGTASMDPERIFSAVSLANPSGGAGMAGTATDYARFLQMLANGGELEGRRLLRAETAAAMAGNQIGDLRVGLRGDGWGFSHGFSVVTDAARARLPAGLYNWGGIWGTGFWVDPANRTLGVVMTQTAVIGSGSITNAVRDAWYAG